MPLYAAYGSNLDPARMGERCPHSPLQTTGWLTGWRLTFGGEDLGWDGALSTIVEDPIEQVFVAVYDVSRDDEADLDGWESADTGLYRKAKVRVSTMTGELAGVDLRARRLRGRPAQRVVPRGDRRRRRGRRRARRLRGRAAPAALPLDRPLSTPPPDAQFKSRRTLQFKSRRTLSSSRAECPWIGPGPGRRAEGRRDSSPTTRPGSAPGR